MAEYIYRAEPIGEGEYSHTLIGELVRCGECKWLVKSEDVCKLLSNNYEPPVYVELSDFCSRGERRTDDETD